MPLQCSERHSDLSCLAGYSRACYLIEPIFEILPISPEYDSYLALPSEHLSSKHSTLGKSLDFSLKRNHQDV